MSLVINQRRFIKKNKEKMDFEITISKMAKLGRGKVFTVPYYEHTSFSFISFFANYLL